jgi:hypothetical protein
MKTIDKKERENRIIARGETSGHSHIIIGECTIERNKESVIIHAGKNCAVKHLLEQSFIEEGIERWTHEHTDIPLQEGESYEYIQQIEYNPYEKLIQQVKD